MPQDSRPRSAHTMALYGGPGEAYEAYNEEAFRHFLLLERKRADRAGRSLLLLLVTLSGEREENTTIVPALADRMFAALHRCVREVDFIGWYRLHRIVGAVLTQGVEHRAQGAEHRADVCPYIVERATAALGEHLPRATSSSVRVRAFQLQSTPRS